MSKAALGLLGIVLAAYLFSRSDAQVPPKDNYAVTDTEAFILLAPEFVAAPIVRSAVWSTDGRYLLVVRETDPITPEVGRKIAAGIQPHAPNPGDVSVLIWSSVTRKSTEVWKSKVEEGGVEESHWLADSSVAILKVWRHRVGTQRSNRQTERVEQLLRINALTGQLRLITELSPATVHYTQIHASPTGPFAVLQTSEDVLQPVTGRDGALKQELRSTNRLYVLRSNGTLGPAIAPPMPNERMIFQWSQDGSQGVLRIDDIPATIEMRKQPGKSDATVYRWFVFDPDSGRSLRKDEPPAPWGESKPKAPIRIRSGVAAIKESNTARNLSLLWLESATPSDNPRALVAADVQTATLSPAEDGVLFISQGAAIVRPILRMPRELFTRMLTEAQKATAMSNAKQLGLGLVMYSQDYDEVFPGPDGINEKIEPYIQNRTIFDGFVYTFPGGSLKDIAKPAETELGYVNGPGGRAIIYVDGHVVWKPD